MPYLDTEVPPVDIVAQEEIPRLCRITTDLKELHQIVVLAVDVATDGNGRIHFEQVRLLLEYLCALSYDPKCLLFRQPALAVKVLLKELDVGLRPVLRREELLVGRH